MDEQKLRSAVRKEIKKSLAEASFLDKTKSTVSNTLGRVTDLGGVKLLKRALSQGSADQKAAGILSVVKELSGGDPAVIEKLKVRLQQKSVRGSMGSSEEI
jgi:DNA-binding transcriptional ArsR family regulator